MRKIKLVLSISVLLMTVFFAYKLLFVALPNSDFKESFFLTLLVFLGFSFLPEVKILK